MTSLLLIKLLSAVASASTIWIPAGWLGFHLGETRATQSNRECRQQPEASTASGVPCR